MDKLDDLLAISDAQYLRAQQSLRALIAKESALRLSLRQLDEQALEARRADFDESQQIRALGADVMWEGWLGRSRSRLNHELAQVLALKEQQIGRVRKAFGKRTASAALLRDHTQDRAKKLRQNALAQAIDQSLWK